jgi:hypothetical protein
VESCDRAFFSAVGEDVGKLTGLLAVLASSGLG